MLISTRNDFLYISFVGLNLNQRTFTLKLRHIINVVDFIAGALKIQKSKLVDPLYCFSRKLI
jgi:hypothetical protein